MTKKIRIHLTSTQKAKLNPAASGKDDLAVPSSKDATTAKESAPGGTADLSDSPPASDMNEVRGSGSDLTGSAKPRPTAAVRLF